MDVARRPAVSVFTATACAYSSRQATSACTISCEVEWNGVEWNGMEWSRMVVVAGLCMHITQHFNRYSLYEVASFPVPCPAFRRLQYGKHWRGTAIYVGHEALIL